MLKEALIPLGVLAFAAGYLIDTWGMPRESVVYPWFLITLCPVLGIAVVLEARKRSAVAEPMDWATVRKPALILGLAIGYIALFVWVGFLPASIAFLIVTMPLLGVRLLTAMLVAVSFAGALYLLFTEVFVLRL